jgi:hypothetical protein
MITKIKFKDLFGKEWSMLFGNSYKDWKDQFEEYVFNLNHWWDSKQMTKCGIFRIVEVESCRDKWFQSGGLKWCSDENAQEQLNIEAELLRLANPRKYQNLKFEQDTVKFNFCQKRLDERFRHLVNKSQEDILDNLKNYSKREV